MTNRRVILKALAATSVILGLPTIGNAQAIFSSTDLGGGLTLLSGAGSNVVIAVGADSVVVVNGGAEANAAALLAEINRISGNLPISTLFNTNWRAEHCGLNALLGTKILGYGRVLIFTSTGKTRAICRCRQPLAPIVLSTKPTV